MRVTPDMTTEGGGKLIDLADFLGADGTGIKAVPDRGQVKIAVDSCMVPCEKIWLDPDDTRALALHLMEMADRAEAGL